MDLFLNSKLLTNKLHPFLKQILVIFGLRMRRPPEVTKRERYLLENIYFLNAAYNENNKNVVK